MYAHPGPEPREGDARPPRNIPNVPPNPAPPAPDVLLRKLRHVRGRMGNPRVGGQPVRLGLRTAGLRRVASALGGEDVLVLGGLGGPGSWMGVALLGWLVVMGRVAGRPWSTARYGGSARRGVHRGDLAQFIIHIWRNTSPKSSVPPWMLTPSPNPRIRGSEPEHQHKRAPGEPTALAASPGPDASSCASLAYPGHFAC